jgi:hypothetical protein
LIHSSKRGKIHKTPLEFLFPGLIDWVRQGKRGKRSIEQEGKRESVRSKGG